MDRTAANLVREVTEAIAAARPALNANGLDVTSVKLELQTEFVGDAGFDATVLKLVELSGKVERSELQTISISFAPPAGLTEDVVSISGVLEQAIVAIASAAQEATAGHDLELSAAEASLQVGFTKDGKVAVFVSGELSRTNTHTLTIGLAPA